MPGPGFPIQLVAAVLGGLKFLEDIFGFLGGSDPKDRPVTFEWPPGSGKTKTTTLREYLERFLPQTYEYALWRTRQREAFQRFQEEGFAMAFTPRFARKVSEIEPIATPQTRIQEGAIFRVLEAALPNLFPPMQREREQQAIRERVRYYNFFAGPLRTSKPGNASEYLLQCVRLRENARQDPRAVSSKGAVGLMQVTNIAVKDLKRVGLLTHV